MALKRIVQLNEGPMDFVRGAARQVVPAVKQTVAAGRQQSALADLTKAITQLVQLVQSQTAQKQQQKPKPQYQQAGTQTQPANTTQQMPLRPQPTFASYLHDADGDLLNEGAWDFMKGVAKATPTFVKGAAKAGGEMALNAFRNKFAHDTTASSLAAAGAKAVRDKAAQQTPAIQIQQLVATIQDILKRTQNPQQVLRKVLGQAAGSGAVANQIYAMIFPTARPTQQPAQQPVRTATQWQQGQQPAPRQQPARTFGPGKRRPRPTGTQP